MTRSGLDVFGGVDTHGRTHHAAAIDSAGRLLGEAEFAATAAGYAALLATAGDNPHRLRSDAALAHPAGISPLPARSGRSDRHRLNRGGDRAANHAIHRIVLCRSATTSAPAPPWPAAPPQG